MLGLGDKIKNQDTDMLLSPILHEVCDFAEGTLLKTIQTTTTGWRLI